MPEQNYTNFSHRILGFTPAPPTCTDVPATFPPVPASAPYIFPEQVMGVDIGQAPEGPPYYDTF